MASKTILLAVAGGVAAFAAVGASASTLGGMSGSSLGSEQTIVAACDANGLTVDYATSYDANLGGFKVTGVKLGGMDAACTGQNIKVILGSTGGAALSEISGTVNGASQTLPVSATVSSSAVAAAAVTISG